MENTLKCQVCMATLSINTTGPWISYPAVLRIAHNANLKAQFSATAFFWAADSMRTWACLGSTEAGKFTFPVGASYTGPSAILSSPLKICHECKGIYT